MALIPCWEEEGSLLQYDPWDSIVKVLTHGFHLPLLRLDRSSKLRHNVVLLCEPISDEQYYVSNVKVIKLPI